jgi:hypothetical protein
MLGPFTINCRTLTLLNNFHYFASCLCCIVRFDWYDYTMLLNNINGFKLNKMDLFTNL